MKNPKEEPKQKCKYMKKVGCIKDICSCNIGPKQETPEEAAEKIYLNYENNDLLYGHSEELQLAYKAGIVDGAKWQQERSYNEEDMHSLMDEYQDWLVNTTLETILTFRGWFTQFKKK